MGNAVNNPLFGEDNWLHLKVPIPNDLRAVSHLKITPSPTKNWISVKNVYLSKQGQPSQICSGKDDIGGTSWLTSFDDGNVATNVNAEEMCISHYGTNAWLGDVTEVEETWASCCGNNDDEYYSGDSKPIGDPGIKYGCWNSQPIADGQTVMDVEFMVDYTEEEIEIGYPAEYLDLYLNVFGFGLKCPELKISNWDVGYSTCGDEYQKAYCLGQSGQETCLGLKEEYFENKYLSCETGVNYEYDEGVYEVCEECKTDEWDCKGCVPTIEATEEKSCYLEPKTLVQVGQEKVSTSVSFEENPKLIDTLIYSKNGDNPKTDEIEYGDFYQAIIMAKIEKFVLFPEIDHPQEVYFFHPTQGNLGTELSLKQLKEYGSVQVFAEANKIKTFPPILTPKSQIPFTYPCQSDE